MTSVKVFKAGNSLAVTVPRELALRLNLRVGDRVRPKIGKMGIAYEPVKRTNKVTPAFSDDPVLREWLTDFEKKHGRALRQLAKR